LYISLYKTRKGGIMRRTTTISEARARLPEMARRVVSTPGAVEYIEHRDFAEKLVLTTESHLQFLETTVAELRRLSTQPFSLEGSIRSKLSDAELEASLAAARAEQAARATSRMREILE
jgi:hypothetical protein